MLHHADALISKFGYGTVEVDEFDMFLIDNGVAADPGTSDTATLKYKGFIQERGKARKALDSAGRTLRAKPFRLLVARPGELYEILPLQEGNAEESAAMRDKWRTYAAGRERMAISNHRSNTQLLRDAKLRHEAGEISTAELEQATHNHRTTEAASRRATAINGYIATLMNEFESLIALTKQEGDE